MLNTNQFPAWDNRTDSDFPMDRRSVSDPYNPSLEHLNNYYANGVFNTMVVTKGSFKFTATDYNSLDQIYKDYMDISIFSVGDFSTNLNCNTNIFFQKNNNPDLNTSPYILQKFGGIYKPCHFDFWQKFVFNPLRRISVFPLEENSAIRCTGYSFPACNQPNDRVAIYDTIKLDMNQELSFPFEDDTYFMTLSNEVSINGVTQPQDKWFHVTQAKNIDFIGLHNDTVIVLGKYNFFKPMNEW